MSASFMQITTNAPLTTIPVKQSPVFLTNVCFVAVFNSLTYILMCYVHQRLNYIGGCLAPNETKRADIPPFTDAPAV
jgi:hypothetical protein